MFSRSFSCELCRWNRLSSRFSFASFSVRLPVKCTHRNYATAVQSRRQTWAFDYRLSPTRYGKFQSTASSAAVDKSTAVKQQELLKNDSKEELETEEWVEQKLDISKLPGYYMRLSKIRLTGLVVLTEMAGFALAPGPMQLSTFLWAALGTGLCSCSANSFNQWLEVPFDSQMARTQNRVLVRGTLSPLHVASFGAVAGTLGITLLLAQVNGITAFLGGLNILLYTSIYTPMKRLSILNTWLGSVVGALPPLMGWAACTGRIDMAGLVLAGILFSWQFPHFNALSWNLRADYSRAGYRMMCVTDPALCRRVALRHCVALLGLSTLMPMLDITSWWFALDSLPLNLWQTWLAYNFYNDSDSKSARRLFRCTLVYLPVIMLLALLHKKQGHSEEADVSEVVQSTGMQATLGIVPEESFLRQEF